jgi:hypothetical protein
MAGRPFVLLGVNTDEDRKAIKAAIVKHDLAWRSWWDGGSTDGPIATQWQIATWPTIYILDHKGVIRHIAESGGGVETEPLDAAIQKLVKAAEQSPTSND